MANKIKDEHGNTYIQQKPFYKKFWFWMLILLVCCVVGTSSSTETDEADTSPKTEKTESHSESEINSEDTSEEGDNEPTIREENETKQNSDKKVPREYISALNSAKSYSETMHMSKRGIYDQLTSEYGEKFSAEAAEYAINNLKADYKKNALKSAESYQDMDMSPAAILDQLTSEYGEQFTPEEAQYAVDNLSV